MVIGAGLTIAIYMLPAILADRMKRRSVLLLALFNVLFGWTVVGWFAALHWAFHPDSAIRLNLIVRNRRRASTQSTIDAIVSRARTRGARGIDADRERQVERERE